MRKVAAVSRPIHHRPLLRLECSGLWVCLDVNIRMPRNYVKLGREGRVCRKGTCRNESKLQFLGVKIKLRSIRTPNRLLIMTMMGMRPGGSSRQALMTSLGGNGAFGLISGPAYCVHSNLRICAAGWKLTVNTFCLQDSKQG